MTGALFTALFTLGYIGFVILVIRPAMVRLVRLYGQKGRLTQGVMALVFVALLLSALATDLIGVHAVFGAFALGAVIPHDSGLARDLTDRLEDLVVVLLLPAFFAFIGMRTEIGLVSGLSNWLLCGLVILTASVGKFGGSLVAARLTGLGWRDAAALGVLMNTRGLMELIVLNIGLELKVLSPTLFAMLVLMAVVTTLATTPLLHLITRKQPIESEPRELEPANRVAEGALPRGGCWRRSPTRRRSGRWSTWRSPRLDQKIARRGWSRWCGGRRAGCARVCARWSAEIGRTRPSCTRRSIMRARSARFIDPQAIWTDDPAGDLLEIAGDPQIRWLLMGFHRPVFGTDLMGGVVKEILERAQNRALDVAVIVHGHERPVDKVFAVVDGSRHGRAALDLAARFARHLKCNLHAVLVPESGAEEPSPALRAILRETGRTAEKWLYTEVLSERTPAQLAYKAQGPLVVMGYDLADELGLPLDDGPGGERCVVIVQGGVEEASSAAPPEHETAVKRAEM